jgi:Zn finger protein HypA/HybF involved in hydrogenase expression
MPEVSDTELTVPEAPPPPVHCRHCGAALENTSLAAETDDWLCPTCDRYQDATVCPVCGGSARISALPQEMQPAVHAPAKPKKEG